MKLGAIQIVVITAIVAILGAILIPTIMLARKHNNPTIGFRNVDYQGHSYLMWTGNYKGALLHHPDCPCVKEATND